MIPWVKPGVLGWWVLRDLARELPTAHTRRVFQDSHPERFSDSDTAHMAHLESLAILGLTMCLEDGFCHPPQPSLFPCPGFSWGLIAEGLDHSLHYRHRTSIKFIRGGGGLTALTRLVN